MIVGHENALTDTFILTYFSDLVLVLIGIHACTVDFLFLFSSCELIQPLLVWSNQTKI